MVMVIQVLCFSNHQNIGSTTSLAASNVGYDDLDSHVTSNQQKEKDKDQGIP